MMVTANKGGMLPSIGGRAAYSARSSGDGARVYFIHCLLQLFRENLQKHPVLLSSKCIVLAHCASVFPTWRDRTYKNKHCERCDGNHDIHPTIVEFFQKERQDVYVVPHRPFAEAGLDASLHLAANDHPLAQRFVQAIAQYRNKNHVSLTQYRPDTNHRYSAWLFLTLQLPASTYNQSHSIPDGCELPIDKAPDSKFHPLFENCLFN